MNIVLGQFFTPKVISDYMVKLFTINVNSSVLDPCFGEGVFITSLLENGYKKIYGIELDKELYSNAVLKFLGKEVNLIFGDFFNDNKKYDGVIMNPPYIRHERINDLEEYGITKHILHKNKVFSELKGQSNMYMYFILKGLDVLNEMGELVAIIPNTWLKESSEFLSIISKKAFVSDIINIKGSVFGNNVSTEVAIIKVVKNRIKNSSHTKSLFFLNDELEELPVEIEDIVYDNDNLVLLSSLASIKRGITTGCNMLYMNEGFEDDHSVDIITSPKKISGMKTKQEFTSRMIAIDSNLEISKELSEYFIEWKNRILKDKKPKTLYNRILRESDWIQKKNNLFDCKGIIFNYMIRDNLAFIRNDKFYVRDNFYIVKPNDTDMNLMFSLLNNYFTFQRIEQNGKSYGRGMLKLQKYDLSNLLVVSPSVISEDDKARLIFLGKKLCKKWSLDTLESISNIISIYERRNSQEAMLKYHELKKRRLKGGSKNV